MRSLEALFFVFVLWGAWGGAKNKDDVAGKGKKTTVYNHQLRNEQFHQPKTWKRLQQLPSKSTWRPANGRNCFLLRCLIQSHTDPTKSTNPSISRLLSRIRKGNTHTEWTLICKKLCAPCKHWSPHSRVSSHFPWCSKQDHYFPKKQVHFLLPLPFQRSLWWTSDTWQWLEILAASRTYFT